MSATDAPIYLLSPANLKGVRGTRLLARGANSPLAARLRSPEGVPIGEVYSHISTLYFRGKLTYGLHFGGKKNTQVIVPGFGLVAPSWALTVERARQIAQCPVDPTCGAYAKPLSQDVAALGEHTVVFLGSLATRKYLDILVPRLRGRLLFPKVFLGCGDMRRGSLLLKAVEAESELEYSTWVEPPQT